MKGHSCNSDYCSKCHKDRIFDARKEALLAGLRWAATKTVPHYTGAAGIEYQAVEDAIAHVERTGQLPDNERPS
jgi:hypothetical protein